MSEGRASSDLHEQPAANAARADDGGWEADDQAEQEAAGQHPARDPEGQLTDRGLGDRTRQELVVIATKAGVKKPANLTKSQLADEVTKASCNHRPVPGA